MIEWLDMYTLALASVHPQELLLYVGYLHASSFDKIGLRSKLHE